MSTPRLEPEVVDNKPKAARPIVTHEVIDGELYRVVKTLVPRAVAQQQLAARKTQLQQELAAIAALEQAAPVEPQK